MAAAYPLDLRERVVCAVAAGASRAQAAAHYQVSHSSAIRWARRVAETGSPAALPMCGKKPFTLAHEEASIRVRVAEKPDITGRELLADLNQRGIEVSHDGVWHFLDQVGRSFKKACTPANRIALTSHGGASNGSDTRTRSPPDG
jgi:transposase